jgi:hypothetical protein
VFLSPTATPAIARISGSRALLVAGAEPKQELDLDRVQGLRSCVHANTLKGFEALIHARKYAIFQANP